MAKTTQMMKCNVFGKQFSVVFQNGVARNPFVLYEIRHGYNKHGVYTDSKRIVAKYQNFEGCLYHLLQMQMPEFKKDVF